MGIFDVFREKESIDKNELDIEIRENYGDNVRKFDLNIEKILENWENYHAIREIIANALDEQIITKTRDIEYNGSVVKTKI